MLKPRKLFAVGLALAAYALAAGVHVARGEDAVKWEVTSDLNGDGISDRASIVDGSDHETSDLHIFLGSAGGGLGNDAKPDIAKTAVVEGTVLAFESRERATLTVTSFAGCTSMWALEETLTVVYRDGAFVIGGFTRVWELSHRLADLNVDVVMGSCSVDFLTGEGRASKGLEDETLVKQRFKPIKLADWSRETRPAICKYDGEE